MSCGGCSKAFGTAEVAACVPCGDIFHLSCAQKLAGDVPGSSMPGNQKKCPVCDRVVIGWRKLFIPVSALADLDGGAAKVVVKTVCREAELLEHQVDVARKGCAQVWKAYYADEREVNKLRREASETRAALAELKRENRSLDRSEMALRRKLDAKKYEENAAAAAAAVTAGVPGVRLSQVIGGARSKVYVGSRRANLLQSSPFTMPGSGGGARN